MPDTPTPEQMARLAMANHPQSPNNRKQHLIGITGSASIVNHPGTQMKKVPSRLVPQARNFDDIVRVLRAMEQGAISKQDISDRSSVRARQVEYVKHAAEALGWTDPNGAITPLGHELLAANDQSSTWAIIRKSISTSSVLSKIAPSLLSYRKPSKKELLTSIQKHSDPQLGTGTSEHRAEGLLAWRRQLVDHKAIRAEETEAQLSLLEETRPIAKTPSEVKDKVVASRPSGFGPNFSDLRDTLRKSPRNTVIISGAGIGKLSNLPTWAELRNTVCQEYGRDDELLRDDYEKQRHQSSITEILGMNDMWVSFSRIKQIMGDTRFVRSIQRLLAPDRDKETNPFYNRVWSMGVRGIVTFNIDETAEQAYAHVFGDTVTSCDIQSPQQYTNLLHADSLPFVFHPHGKLSAPAGWVFTVKDRDKALNNLAYTKYMTGLLMTKTIVMAGFNPADIAFESHVIDTVRTIGETAPRIYIICAREHLTPETRERYESWGFRIVAYSIRDGEANPHIELLDILDRIAEYVPDTDLPSSIFEGQLLPPSELPPDDELAQLDEEIIRERLNASVAYIVNEYDTSEKVQVKHISDLFEQYPRSTHKAWFFVPGSAKLGHLFGRQVDKEIGGGAFGRVYEAHDANGPLAVKILLSEVKKDPTYLLSFRRGIKSMKILDARQVKGMVRIKESYEVPPTVFMEYISGITIDEAVEHGFVDGMRKKLNLLERIADIVATAHELDEVVLHRDLKPANVMLRDPIHGEDQFDVVVLDFDLSWHVGSHELSVAHNARMQGYAAPEQVRNGDAVPSATTRNIAVDSFGFGMLVFFMFLERHPTPGEQRTPHFTHSIYSAATKYNKSAWNCIPRQISNLTHACIQDNQNRRPSVREAQIMLRTLISVLDDDALGADDPNLRIEILDRIFENKTERTIERDGALLIDEAAIGLTTSISLLPLTDGRGELTVTVSRTQQDHDHRTSFLKYAPAKSQRAAADLRNAGFDFADSSLSTTTIKVVAKLTQANWSNSVIRRIVEGIRTCRHHLTS